MFLLHRSVTLRGVTRYTVMFCRCPPFAVGTGVGPGGSVGAVARVRPGGGVDACWRFFLRGRNITRTNDADLPHGCMRPDVVLRKCAQTCDCRITTVRVSANGVRVTFISGAVFGLGSALRFRSEQFSSNNMCITSKYAYEMLSSDSRKLGVNASLVVALRWLPRGPP